MKKSGRRQQRTLVAIALLSCWAAQSCDTNDGPVEEFGEEVDEAADEVEDEAN